MYMLIGIRFWFIALLGPYHCISVSFNLSVSRCVSGIDLGQWEQGCSCHWRLHVAFRHTEEVWVGEGILSGHTSLGVEVHQLLYRWRVVSVSHIQIACRAYCSVYGQTICSCTRGSQHRLQDGIISQTSAFKARPSLSYSKKMNTRYNTVNL